MRRTLMSQLGTLLLLRTFAQAHSLALPVIHAYVTDHVSDHWPEEYFKEHILELADGRGVLRQAGFPDVLFPSLDAALAVAVGTPIPAPWLVDVWAHGYEV